MNILIHKKFDIKPSEHVKIYENIKLFDYSNYFIFGTPYDCQYLLSNRIGKIKYYNPPITEEISCLKKHYINNIGYFKTVYQLDNSDIGKFCKSAKKTDMIKGQIIEDKYDLNFIKENNREDILVYLSDKKDITDEMKIWVINGEPITYSKYKSLDLKTSSYPIEIDKYFEYVRKIDKLWPIDDMYIINIGICNNKFYVIDYDCISSTPFFNADSDKIINSILKYLC